MGVKMTVEEEEVPVPVRLMVCGLLLALSVMVTVPVRVPVAVGWKVTLMVQLPPAVTEPPQLLVWAKSPLIATLVIVRAVVPLLVRVEVKALLVCPTVVLGKVREAGDTLAVGVVTPVPVRATD